MAVVRCRHCNVPLLEEEAAGPACPTCGGSLAPDERASSAAAPEAPPPGPPRPWGLIVAVAALAGLSLLLLTRPAQEANAEGESAYKALLEQKKKAEEGLDAARKREASFPGQIEAARASEKQKWSARLEAEVKKRQGAEARLKDALAQLDAADRRTRKAEHALAAERAVTGFGADGTLVLPRPVQPPGVYRLEALKGRQVKLVGQIANLQVKSLDAEASLDASGLKARVATIEGPVQGKSRVRLTCAPLGSITLASVEGGSDVELNSSSGRATVTKIKGGSRLVVRSSAVGGSVTITSVEEGAQIEIDAPTSRVQVFNVSGNSRIRVKARYVQFGTITGTSTEARVTLSTGGTLLCNQMLGGSKLLWKKANPSDRKPIISQGMLAPGAVFEEEN